MGKPSSSTGAQETELSDALLKPSDDDVAEFKEFINILRVTEGFPEKPTDEEKAVAMDKYLVWTDSGKPRPTLGDKKPEVQKITRIYRRKANGKQYLSYVVEGKSEQIGMETEITYGKTPSGDEDKTIVIERKRFPNKEYKEKEAREILKKAKRYTENVKLRFVFLGSVIPIHNEDNFFGDFDGLIEDSRKGKVI
jgi:hypothetical protein